MAATRFTDIYCCRACGRCVHRNARRCDNCGNDPRDTNITASGGYEEAADNDGPPLHKTERTKLPTNTQKRRPHIKRRK